MKISKNSWHYKLIDREFGGVPKNVTICQYVRKFLLNIGALALLTIVTSIGLILLLDPLVSIVLYFIFDVGFIPFIHPATTGIGLVMWVIALCTACAHFFRVFIVDKIVDAYYARSSHVNEGTLNKPPGIIRARYKAWKEKWCPVVEFEDE